MIPGRLRILLTAGLTLSAIACSDGGDSDSGSGSSVLGGADEKTYPNGHPLSLQSSDPAVTGVEDDLLSLCNSYRVSNGLNALIDDAGMRKVSRAHSKHQIVHDFFAHQNPEGDSAGERLTACGQNWLAAGENLAAGYAGAQDAFNGWLGSPGHKANLDNALWTHTGTGYWNDPADGGNVIYSRYFTQAFKKN